jgi:hypothetical protein
MSFRHILKERPGDVAAAKEEVEKKMAILFNFKKQHHNGKYFLILLYLYLSFFSSFFI